MDPFEASKRFYTDPEYARDLGWPTNPRTGEALGLYPFFLPVERVRDGMVTLDGRQLIMLGSNNYLGLTGHPHVVESAVRATEQFGTGCTGSRFLNGTLELHLELEQRLADFVGKPAVLVFSTGYQTNLGTLTALADRGTVFICDRDVHASVIDAVMLAKSQRQAACRFYRHRDLQSLEKILKRYGDESALFVVTDGVFSMGGDIAPVPALAQVCQKYGARLIVDDAHGIGVLGRGRGTAAHFNCEDSVDLVIGTFSKSLASMGGFVAGSKEVIHWIQHRSRPYMFSASLSPANVGAVLGALDVIEKEPERVQRVVEIAARMSAELRSMGYDLCDSETPIVPVHIGDQFRALQAWEVLRKAGVYANVALPPAVKPNRALLRTSYMATHTDEQLEKVLEAFRRVLKKLSGSRRGRRTATGAQGNRR
jgi:8-amino-7-oxononanoate synthase